ncbi:LapA family protein [Vibrio hippocampi]|uniref:Probable lipopolysaccharide assembly protein A n=1 Tax=Vibrio hippocampi TaxID=654686 RepID=A0ABN8DIK4_9VIBR|nr:lipopolysaccharide assembly protein LapA domain-containing protein [Vibrio hippocampi]CAH0526509.1 Lipopolysaccharide assembly protein A [Vibrio hippocampi]
MKIIKIILLLVLFLVTLALGSQNQEVVNFNYLIAQGDFHLSTLLGVVFITGFVVSWAIFGTLYVRSQLTVKKLKRQIRKSGNVAEAKPKKVSKDSSTKEVAQVTADN